MPAYIWRKMGLSILVTHKNEFGLLAKKWSTRNFTKRSLNLSGKASGKATDQGRKCDKHIE